MVNSYKSVNKVKFLLFVFISLPLFIHMLHAKPLSGIKESAVQQDAYLFRNLRELWQRQVPVQGKAL